MNLKRICEFDKVSTISDTDMVNVILKFGSEDEIIKILLKSSNL